MILRFTTSFRVEMESTHETNANPDGGLREMDKGRREMIVDSAKNQDRGGRLPGSILSLPPHFAPQPRNGASGRRARGPPAIDGDPTLRVQNRCEARRLMSFSHCLRIATLGFAQSQVYL
jgi:hypothetical protein